MKSVHTISRIGIRPSRFISDYGTNAIFFGEGQALHCNIDGICLNRLECQDNIQEGVFAEGKAIVALNSGVLNFNRINNRSNKTIESRRTVHALFPGPDSDSFYIATRRVMHLEFELISGNREKNVIFKIKRECGIKMLFAGADDLSDVSIEHYKDETYICDKSPRVTVFSGSQLSKTIECFPVPIYRAVQAPSGSMYFVGASGKMVQAFDENGEIFAKELPFAVKKVLCSASRVVAICEHGSIFILDLKGNITDGGLLFTEIIDSKVSPDGFIWCLTEDGTLAIICEEKAELSLKINQYLHIDTAGRRTLFQEALCGALEKNKISKLKESELRSKSLKLNKKERELKSVECKLKQELAKLAPLLDEVKRREKQAQDKLNSAKALETEMQRFCTAEELCNKLKELKKKADDDKKAFPATEEEIDNIEKEIEESRKLKQELVEAHKNKSESLSGLKTELDKLSREEEVLSKDYDESARKLSELNSSIEQRKDFIKNAPEQIKTIKEEEKGYALKIKELKEKIAAHKEKISAAKIEAEAVENTFNNETQKLNNILSSAEILRKKQGNLPEIDKLTQQLIGLINKTIPEKEGE